MRHVEIDWPHQHEVELGQIAGLVRSKFAQFYTWKVGNQGERPWRHSPQWDGGMYKGRQYQNTWQKIVLFMREHKLPIVEYLNFAVVLQDLFELPQPNILLGTKRLAAFAAWKSDYRRRCDQMRVSYESAMSRASCDLGGFEECAELSNQPLTPASQWAIFLRAIEDPVFRYAWAATVKRDVEMQKAHESAELKYATQPAIYDAVLFQMLPESFRAAAKRRYFIGLFEDHKFDR